MQNFLNRLCLFLNILIKIYGTNGINIAIPEKAFLDEVYFSCRGKTILDPDELDTKKLSMELLRKYAARFPAYVRRRMAELVPT